MRIAIVALTPRGLATGRRIATFLTRPFMFCHPGLREMLKGQNDPGATGEKAALRAQARTFFFSRDLKSFTAELFSSFDAIIFVMAAGIAVRMIAPWLQHKTTDPAIITVDDTGTFVVPLLGGHQGGANDLAQQIADEIGATAVITTATDRSRLLAFDLWAKRRGWTLEHAADLKKISKAQLAGSELLIYSDLARAEQAAVRELFPSCRLVRDTVELQTARHGVVFLSNRSSLPQPPGGVPFIVLRPRNLVAGIGCRRGVSASAVTAALKGALDLAGRVSGGLQSIATIELKGEEKGLRETARCFRVPLQVFSNEQIQQIENRFVGSEFVRRNTGVGAVSEPCAVLGSGGGALILAKTGFKGITVALAESPLF